MPETPFLLEKMPVFFLWPMPAEMVKPGFIIGFLRSNDQRCTFKTASGLLKNPSCQKQDSLSETSLSDL